MNEEKLDFDREKFLQLFIGGLHPEVTKEEFHNYFLNYGKIMESRLVFDKLTGKKHSLKSQENLEDLASLPSKRKKSQEIY